MIDFHSHILPGMDDGSSSVEMSLSMLEESARQGVDILFASSHFYADEDDPESYLIRRTQAFDELSEAMAASNGVYPEVRLGAEILYFPGMSVAEELRSLKMGNTPCLLIEPPMGRWTESMLDEIEETGSNLRCVPVIAHIDRYMRVMQDPTLFDRLEGRKILIQVNAGFFIRPETSDMALEYLHEDRIHFIGSDCHNMDSRPPNLGSAADVIRNSGATDSFAKLNRRIYNFLSMTL